MKRTSLRTSPRHRKRQHSPQYDALESPERFQSPDAWPYRRDASKQARTVEARPRKRPNNDATTRAYSSGAPSRLRSLRISNTAPDIDDRSLKDAAFHRFKKYGRIDVFLSGRGSQRELVIDFDAEESARNAIKSEQNRSLFEYSMKIAFDATTASERRCHDDGDDAEDGDDRRDYDVRSSKAFDSQSPSRTLFVGSLQRNVSESELRELFLVYGRIEGIDVKRGVGSTKATYAFVKFTTLDSAMKAKDAMQGYHMGRSRMRIGYGRGSPSTCLWVGNLARWITSVELEQEFDRFGAISRIEYLPNDHCAYIKYDSFDGANAALNDMKGFRMGGQPLHVDFADENQLSGVGVRSGSAERHRRRHHYQQFSPPPPVSRSNGSRLYDDGVRPYPRPSSRRLVNSHGNDPDDCRATLLRKRGGGGGGGYSSDDVSKKTRHLSMEEGYHRDNSKVEARQRSYSQHQESSEYRHHHRHDVVVVAAADERGYRRDRFSSSSSSRIGGGERISLERKRKPRRSRSRSPMRKMERRRSLTTTRKRGGGGERERERETRNDGKSKKDDHREKEREDNKGEDISTSNATVTSSSAAAAKVETLADLSKRFAVAWRGTLMIKTNSVSVRMHLIAGDPGLADTLLRGGQGQTIANTSFSVQQRLRLEQSKLEEVNRKVNSAGPSGHCMLLALPVAASKLALAASGDGSKAIPLKNLIVYLKQREAAGVVMLSGPAQNDGKPTNGVMYIFPPCIFSQQHLCRVASSLPSEPSKEEHLLIIVVRET